MNSLNFARHHRPSKAARSLQIGFRGSLACSLALSLACSALLVPTATAQITAAPKSATVPVTHNCVKWRLILPQDLKATVSPDNVDVTYPTQVAPGQTFTVDIQPGAMRAGGTRIGRFSYDITLPVANAEILGLSVVGGQSGITGDTIKFERANADGKINPNGPIARIWGGYSVSSGDNTGQTNTSRGILVAANTNFRLPKVRMTLRAPRIDPIGKVISAGLARSGQNGDPNATDNTMQFNEAYLLDATSFYCGSSANAGSLTSTTVVDSPIVIAPSTTAMTASTFSAGDRSFATFSAKVTAPDATAAEISTSLVEFVRADTGEVITTARPGADGIATGGYIFPSLPAGQTSASYRIFARVTSPNGFLTPSTSGQATVTINYVNYTDVPVTATLTASRGETADPTPVAVTAVVTRTDGGTLPSTGLMAQLLRNGQPVGINAPIVNGRVTLNDALPRTTDTTTYRYTVRIGPSGVGTSLYNGISPQALDVTIPGTSPSGPTPDPTCPPMVTNLTGSLGSSIPAYMCEPSSFFGSLTNSVGDATLSTAMFGK